MNIIDNISNIKVLKFNGILGIAICFGIFFIFLATNIGYKKKKNVTILKNLLTNFIWITRLLASKNYRNQTLI